MYTFNIHYNFFGEYKRDNYFIKFVVTIKNITVAFKNARRSHIQTLNLHFYTTVYLEKSSRIKLYTHMYI